MEIVSLLVEGKREKQISTILSISRGAVAVHIQEACQKMEVENRIQLIVLFVRWQVVQEMQNDKR
jgi:DNA-binding NarL/FixJ family response regulator